MCILIVNNNALFLQSLQNAFKVKGYDVIATVDSLKVNRFFLEYKPFAIVFDVAMLEKDGFEIIKDIRTVCKKTFVIAMTDNECYFRAIKKLGANEALPMSTHPDAIVSVIHNNRLMPVKSSKIIYQETTCSL